MGAQLAQLEKQEAESFAKAGRDAYEALHAAFVALTDQSEAHHQALATLSEQRANLAAEASSRLAAWPELLAAILREHVPLDDEKKPRGCVLSGLS